MYFPIHLKIYSKMFRSNHFKLRNSSINKYTKKTKIIHIIHIICNIFNLIFTQYVRLI